MALVPDVLDLLRRQVRRFAELLADDIEQQAGIRLLWREVSTGVKRPKEAIPATATLVPAAKIQATCAHILGAGPNVGSLCGKRVSPLSRTGRYCATHAAAKEKPEDPLQTKLPYAKPTSAVVEKASLVALAKIAGYLVNPTTRLAFDSVKMAVGKEVGGKIVPLGPEDVDFCQKQQIPFCVTP